MKRMNYLKRIPRQLPKGEVLVDNQVVGPVQRLGTRGFRAWTQELDDILTVCRCDWAGADLHGLVHYRVKRQHAAQKGDRP